MIMDIKQRKIKIEARIKLNYNIQQNWIQESREQNRSSSLKKTDRIARMEVDYSSSILIS